MSPTPPSSRRGNGEVNILAMLDGQTDQPLSRRFLALPVALWYGLVGVLACALLGALAWLARDPGGGRSGIRDGAAAPPTPITAPAPAPAAQGATIVNLAPAAGDAAQVGPAPVDAMAAAPSGHGGRDGAGNVRAASGLVGSHGVPAPQRTGASTAARPPSAAARPDGPPRKRPAAPAKSGTTSGSVDTDVALISAIIQHVNKQGDTLDGSDVKDAKDAKSPTNRR